MAYAVSSSTPPPLYHDGQAPDSVAPKLITELFLWSSLCAGPSFLFFSTIWGDRDPGRVVKVQHIAASHFLPVCPSPSFTVATTAGSTTLSDPRRSCIALLIVPGTRFSTYTTTALDSFILMCTCAYSTGRKVLQYQVYSFVISVDHYGCLCKVQLRP